MLLNSNNIIYLVQKKEKDREIYGDIKSENAANPILPVDNVHRKIVTKVKKKFNLNYKIIKEIPDKVG